MIHDAGNHDQQKSINSKLDMIKRHQHHPTEHHPHPNGDRSPEAGSDPLQGLSRDPEGVLVVAP